MANNAPPTTGPPVTTRQQPPSPGKGGNPEKSGALTWRGRDSENQEPPAGGDAQWPAPAGILLVTSMNDAVVYDDGVDVETANIAWRQVGRDQAAGVAAGRRDCYRLDRKITSASGLALK